LPPESEAAVLLIKECGICKLALWCFGCTA
jgi:hypothetical protein